MRSQWFTVGMAISLSAATFASPIGSEMEQPWRGTDANGKAIPLDYNYGLNLDTGSNVETAVLQHPWSGSWWWTKSGSVAVRWRTALVWSADHQYKDWPSYDQSDSMTYQPFSADDLAKMSEDQIRESTSAIEKLDIVNGRADVRLWSSDPAKNGYYSNLGSVRGFVEGIVRENPKQLSYHGLCHGFSQASIWLPEPKAVVIPVTYTLSDGSTKTIRVPFGSGDLKALATYFYGQRTYTRNSNMNMIGSNEAAMNPAGFHLLLMNLTATDGKSFVVDTTPGDTVWNYPVWKFKMSTSRAYAASSSYDPNVTQAVNVATDVTYMQTSNPTQNELPEITREYGDDPSIGYDRLETHRKYSYTLELNSGGRIVGGYWNGGPQADFAWTLKKAIPFDGEYAILSKYWQAAR
ncbi:MAG: hypothetical protein JST04_11215 [Bdellovibrionales bacterium]|nr:hypothetical protein [Bdellovibrionales bacterium]